MKNWLTHGVIDPLGIGVACMVAVAITPATSAAGSDGDWRGMFDVYGDFRFRVEQDWDSERSSGRDREDRGRLRVRGRIGLKVKPHEMIELNGRLRSGSNNSQQSPHITIWDWDDNPHGDSDFVFDKWYGKVKSDKFWAWAGRNSLPFWKQNELLWDDDVTVAGGALGFSLPLGAGNLKGNAGYAALPDGMKHFHGEVATGQLVYSSKINDIDITIAGGVVLTDGDGSPAESARTATDAPLRKGNWGRDYTIWVGDIQANTKVADFPVRLGFDYFHNSEDYSPADIAGFSASDDVDADDTDGFVVSLLIGAKKNKGDWQLGYYYADIETFAVNASYAQDDWMRWGSRNQTDSSDFHGSEFRAVYVPWKNWNLVARLYSVESNNNPQDGKRFRFDINWKY